MFRKIHRLLALFLFIVFLTSCMPAPSIAVHREPESWSYLNPEPTPPPAFDPGVLDPFRIDFRSADLSQLDLSNSLDGLIYANFDSQTVWPPAGRLPAGFDPQLVMELGKDPGLGVRELHERGITGEGVGIAIIDQVLLADHVEYADRIRVYEEAEDVPDYWGLSMHGPSVASIAVGETVGVAPGADLYFIAMGNCHGSVDIERFDYSCLARDILRIVEINEELPARRRIRVLSMSISWWPENEGYDEITAAVDVAREAGIFVVGGNFQEEYGFALDGLGRSPLSDPNDFQAYGPNVWRGSEYYEDGFAESLLFVPMDARTTASPTGYEDYAFFGTGGGSWCVPYLAGVYALAVQVKPEITPEEFWSTALATGRTIQIEHDGSTYPFGTIIDPPALIAALEE